MWCACGWNVVDDLLIALSSRVVFVDSHGAESKSNLRYADRSPGVKRATRAPLLILTGLEV